MSHPILSGPMTQLGYLTDDIEATARTWTAATDIGPWTLMKNVTMEAVVEGERSDIMIDVALAYQGDMQIELIRPINDAPSPYREYADAGIWGLHHVQFTTDDMETTLANAKQAGLELSCFIDQGGGKYAYLKGPNVWFEVMEPSAPLLGLFDMIKAKSTGWDGKELLQELAL